MSTVASSDRALEVPLLPVSPQMPPKRDEAALQEEEELQLAIALSQSEAEEKERAVSLLTSLLASHARGECFFLKRNTSCVYFFFSLQRQKNSYTAYPKAEPTPVTSSAPPVSTLYSSPVVRLRAQSCSTGPRPCTAHLWDTCTRASALMHIS